MTSQMDDPYCLARFVEAQDPVFDEVCAELEAGQKRTHWMWFIFPQIAGLGRSAMAQIYAIAYRGEAEAYLKHPILGERLRHCTRLVNRIEGRSAEEILGPIDAVKFRSSMTLFAKVADQNEEFEAALETHFGGKEDEMTLARL